MKRIYLHILLCIAAFFSSCSTDVDLNTPWEEINIIYGLLDAGDSVQYIKINKAFQNEGMDYIKAASEKDSLFHADSLSVVLQEWQGAVHINDIPLYKIESDIKDSGVFHHPHQYLYRTPWEFELNPGSHYELKVRNTITGHESSAISEVVHSITPAFPKPGNMVNMSGNGVNRFSWISGKNARFYDFGINIHYTEYPSNDPSNKVEKVLPWVHVKNRLTTHTNGNEEISIRIDNEEFFKYLAARIEVNPSLSRQFNKLEFKLSAGASEIYNYMVVNQPSIGLVQKKPEYTNIENGYGIFSSRSFDHFDVFVTPSTMDSIVGGRHSYMLGFVK